MIIRKITRRGPSSNSFKTIGFLAVICVITVVLTLGILSFRLYYSCRKVVDSHLNSEKWSLPSTIYADAPMLYEGMPLKPSWLIEYFQKLAYHRNSDAKVGQGEYFGSGSEILFYPNDFLSKRSNKIFPVRISFDSQGIRKLQNVQTKEDIPAYELEPVAISNLFGTEWEKRTLVRFKDLPPHLIHAVIAIEDRRFYQHHGVDFQGIVRAIWNDTFGNNQLQGGSTITQQLVKNFYLTPERSIRRKISEAVMALLMERRQTKDQILELYLNEIYLGQRGAMSINGVGEASRLYFRKDVRHITIPEAALLAGMIQAPNAYNPYRHPKEAKSRRDTVLLAMKKMEFLSDKDYEQNVASPLTVFTFDTRINLAPYFGDVVKAQLLEKYKPDAIYTKNLHIFTSLDLDMQQYAEEALSSGLAQIDRLRQKRTKKSVQGCLIAIEPQTGYIRAFVGGRSYSRSQFDRISQASRQPGSVFKPVVYAAALEEAFATKSRIYTPATLIDDGPWRLQYADKVWEPKNYDGQYHGIVTLRRALAQSMNIATAKLALDVGLSNVAKLGKKMGFENVKPYPSLALGTFEVSPWQVATAYSIFANGGVKPELRTVKKVTNADGLMLERSQIDVRRVIHSQTAYIITDMLETVLSQGTGASVRRSGFSRTAAGKTGTTDEYRDAWFVGYTPNLLCVVWTGYDDNTPLKMTGAEAALPIWVDFMKKATRYLPEEDFTSPQGIVIRMIDPTTGLLATEDCPVAIPEKFVQGTEPTSTCNQHEHHWWNIFG